MPKYIIKATYEYETRSPIEAPNKAEALASFYSDLNLHYVSTEEEEVTTVCDECEEEEDSCYCDEEEGDN